jgi:hypothetical protein
MNEDHLAEFASRLGDVLAEFEIDTESFQLNIIVPKSYYDGVKDNFSVRNPLDVVVGTQGDDWSIRVMYLFQNHD